MAPSPSLFSFFSSLILLLKMTSKCPPPTRSARPRLLSNYLPNTNTISPLIVVSTQRSAAT
jgi:hypothetical protein